MELKFTGCSSLIAAFIHVVIEFNPAYANDSSAVLAADGLEFTSSKFIVMAREDLHLSPSEVRVRYIFRNEADHNIMTTVAFPLPEVDQSEIANVLLPEPDQENFVDFHVTVDGRQVLPRLEQKAFADNGTDITPILQKAGLPVNSRLPGWVEKVRALPDEIWRHLVKLGLFDIGDAKPSNRSVEFSPTWNLKATFHWEQSFPVGRTITIEHSYKPILGVFTIYSDKQLLHDYRNYCLDNQGIANVRNLIKQAQAAVKMNPQKLAGVSAVEVGYVLTTGASWKGSIGDFYLTIDKEKPQAIISLCMHGLKNTGATTFKVERTNFIPKEDIRLIIFSE